MFSKGEDTGRRWNNLLSVILSDIRLPVEWNGDNTRLPIGARSLARPGCEVSIVPFLTFLELFESASDTLYFSTCLIVNVLRLFQAAIG